MSFLEAVLIIATLLCALTAGFVFAFATVVMPGIGRLGDKAFIRGFQVIDGIIQSGQPVFGLVWVGSGVALVLSAGMAGLHLDGLDQVVVIGSAVAYILGVQLPTFRINVPLNNALQALDTETMDEAALASARQDFEDRWVRWNSIRTGIACLVSTALMLVLLWL